MSDTARRDTANGIWLCRNCHKLIDSDALAYPAELLFRWRAEHERLCLERIGNRSAVLRFDVMEGKYRSLFGEDDLAMQIAREQGPFWEYLLSAELIRHHLRSPARRWRDLNDRLYTRRLERIGGADCMSWFRTKVEEAQQFIPAITELYTTRLQRSWGEPGVPGDVEEIAHVCSLIGAVGEELIRWEEDVAFVRFPEVFEGIRRGLSGAAGHQFDELLKVADVLESGIKEAESAAEGERTVIRHTLTFELPPQWEENLSREFDVLNEKIERGDIELD